MSSITFNELVENIAVNTDIDAATVKLVLRDLGDLVQSEVENGNPITVPGVARLAPVYRPAKPKRIVNFGGVEREAAPKAASIAVKASAVPSVKQSAPSTRSAAGKALAAEAAKKQRVRDRQAAARERAERGTAKQSRRGVRVFA